jgi:hypothetical protein
MVFRAVAAVAILAAAGQVWAYDTNKYFFGQLFVFERAEVYASNNSGRVSLLRPGGVDELHDGPTAVAVEGIIDPEAVQHVKQLLGSFPINEVYLDSPGGDLFAGLELGRTLHAAKLEAIVTQDSQCQSACALAFLGGVSRQFQAKPDQIGFHRQYYIVKGKQVYGSWAKDVATIRKYLGEVGATGITADEIVATTGIANFNNEALQVRHITTNPPEAIAAIARVAMQRSGMSAYELLRSACHHYDPKPGTVDDEILSKYWSMALNDMATPNPIGWSYSRCQGLAPAFREPMIAAGTKSISSGFTPEQVEKFISDRQKELKGVGEDPLAFDKQYTVETTTDGKDLDQGADSYAYYLEARKDLHDNVFKSAGAQ